MKALAVLFVGLLTFTTVFDAEARRMGGARNLGTQRQAVTPQQQAAPKAPAQQQAQQQGAAAQPAATTGNKWLGPLAGLALGAGLTALFLNNGPAGLLAALALLALIGFAAYYAARMMRARAQGAPLQYAGAGADVRPPLAVSGGPAPHAVAATSGWPAEFDAAEFVRHARLNFVRLQAAHDRGDKTTLGDFLTPTMAREIAADIDARGGNAQQTEVVTLNAEVLDVATEGNRYIVSVRFSGLIREAANEQPAEFSEIWHLEKPRTGRGGWLVAGIQQIQ